MWLIEDKSIGEEIDVQVLTTKVLSSIQVVFVHRGLVFFFFFFFYRSGSALHRRSSALLGHILCRGLPIVRYFVHGSSGTRTHVLTLTRRTFNIFCIIYNFFFFY